MVSVTGRDECSLSWPEEKQQLHKQIFFFFFLNINSVGQGFGENIVGFLSTP